MIVLLLNKSETYKRAILFQFKMPTLVKTIFKKG